jgi:hypothetical protein
MNKFGAMAIIVGFALSFSVVAGQPMTKDAYKAEKEHIEDDYKADKARCGYLSGNAEDVCVAEAKGNNATAKAVLEATYEPSKENRYKADIARVEADYEVAKEKCDDQAGKAKDVCLKDAKAAEAAAKANVKKEK